MEGKYNNLKKKVFELIGDKYDLEAIKEYFKDNINSRRALSHIKSLHDLVEILEERDVLSYQCPLPLLYLGRDVLKNDCVTKAVSVYKEIILDETDTICMCGIKLTYIPHNPHSNHLQTEGNKCNIGPINSSSADLEEAIRNIANRIYNNSWRVLASALDVYEKQIDVCYQKHPKDPKKQAFEMLNFWLKNDKENATIERLDKALDARLCQRVGFGTHLRIPLAGINS